MIVWRQDIVSDPQICHGQLCAKGTRVLLTNILDSLAEGAKPEGHPAASASIGSMHARS